MCLTHPLVVFVCLFLVGKGRLGSMVKYAENHDFAALCYSAMAKYGRIKKKGFVIVALLLFM